MTQAMPLSVSVIVITYERPEALRECLRCLGAQSAPAEQVIVVDASRGTDSAEVALSHPGVEYVANPSGAGNMTDSRNVGLRFARGEVIAFLDDDAYAEAGYVAALRGAYRDQSVAMGCARTLNGQPGEELLGSEAVGRLLGSGALTANFAVALPAPVEIDHGVGATMSFRRDTLAELGGFRDGYGGSALREETDAFLRARALGRRALYIPDAVARHVGAPRPRGRRFGYRYQYWASRNHALLLINNFGIRTPIFRRHFLGTVAYRGEAARSTAGRLVRRALTLAGLFQACALSLLTQRGRALPVRREDAVGLDLRRRLSAPRS